MDADPHYNAANRTRHTLAECQNVVGQRATLTLTGTIVAALEHNAGAFVKLEVDERWGFAPGTRFGMDLEAFDVLEDGEPHAT